MPRTKRIFKKNTSEGVKPSNSKLDPDVVTAYMKSLDTKVAVSEMEAQAHANQALLSIDNLLSESSLKFRQYGDMRIVDLQNTKPKEMSTLCEQSMKAINASKVRRRERSCSVVNKGANLQSISKTVRSSRSLSRSKKLPSGSSHVTPMNRQPPLSYGMITPKVIPNTPQVILRRPKQGELAVSMQGSPLMVDHIVSQEKPSVNIPLCDGRVFSIQPEKGIRPSLIPDINSELRNQIQTLRDNLSKVLSNK